MKPPSIKTRVLVPLTFALVIILYASTLTVYWLQKLDVKEQLARDLRSSQRYFRTELENDVALMRAALAGIAENHLLQEAFRSGDRREVYDQIEPIFQKLGKNHQITHFDLLDSRRRTFLRMDDESRSGNEVSQFTTLEAEKTGEVASGLEFDPINGFLSIRVVAPWYSQGRLIGYLELGKAIDHITNKMQNVLDVELFVAAEKRYLVRSERMEEGEVNKHHPEWDRFQTSALLDQTLEVVPKAIEDRLNRNSSQLSGKPAEIFVNERRFWIGYIPLMDASGMRIGEIKPDTNPQMAASALLYYISGVEFAWLSVPDLFSVKKLSFDLAETFISGLENS